MKKRQNTLNKIESVKNLNHVTHPLVGCIMIILTTEHKLLDTVVEMGPILSNSIFTQTLMFSMKVHFNSLKTISFNVSKMIFSSKSKMQTIDIY